MSFESYLRAVKGYFLMGGVTWATSYMRVLKEHRPDLYEAMKMEDLDLSHGEQAFSFIYYLSEKWDE